MAAAVADDGVVHEAPERPAVGGSGVVYGGSGPGEHQDEAEEEVLASGGGPVGRGDRCAQQEGVGHLDWEGEVIDVVTAGLDNVFGQGGEVGGGGSGEREAGSDHWGVRALSEDVVGAGGGAGAEGAGGAAGCRAEQLVGLWPLLDAPLLGAVAVVEGAGAEAVRAQGE